jgi:carboxyl-terminal processing protease
MRSNKGCHGRKELMMIKNWSFAFVVGCLALSVSTPLWSQSSDQAETPFSSETAWADFEALLRSRYAYFQREGVDGDAILSHFRTTAVATTSQEAMVDVIQQAAMNFADPHLTVGPFRGDEASLIPTGSDIHAEYQEGLVKVVDVRTGGDAAKQGIEQGDVIVAIGGRSPREAIEVLLGVPFDQLSPVQVHHGLNTVLAGVFGQRRSLMIERNSQRRSVELAAVADQLDAMAEQPLLTWRWVGDVAIVRFNNSLGNNDTIAAFRASFPEFSRARAILIDLRNTPSGGNTTVARAIMEGFTGCPRPYQQHDYVFEQRNYGVPRQAIELVLPGSSQFTGRVYVASGPWTGSMGEGLTIGFDALGATTIGAPMADLLGGIENVTLASSGARIDISVERLLHVDGSPREDFVPRLPVQASEINADGVDPVLSAMQADLRRRRPQTAVTGGPLVWPGFRPCLR